MKKCVVFIILMFCAVNQLSVAMDEDGQDYTESDSSESNEDQSAETQESDQNESSDDNSGVESESDADTDVKEKNPEEKEISKKAYVKSIVDNILKLKRDDSEEVSTGHGRGKRAKSGKKINQLLTHIQEDIKKLNKYLSDGYSEKSTDKNKDENENKKINKTSKKRSHSKRNKRSSRNRYGSSRKNYYTVKRIGAGNSKKYIPGSSSLGGYHSGYKSKPWGSLTNNKGSIERSYTVKSWGDGEHSTTESIPNHLTTKNYFSDKSSCNGNVCEQI